MVVRGYSFDIPFEYRQHTCLHDLGFPTDAVIPNQGQAARRTVGIDPLRSPTEDGTPFLFERRAEGKVFRYDGGGEIRLEVKCDTNACNLRPARYRNILQICKRR